MAEHPNARPEPTLSDLGFQSGPVIALAGNHQRGLGNALEEIQKNLDALVLLQTPQIEKLRCGRFSALRTPHSALDAEMNDVDLIKRRPMRLRDLTRGGARNRQEPRTPVQEAQRQRLEQQRGEPPLAAHLGHVVVGVHVVHERHARLAQPQRREECDAVHHLQHHVGVAPEPAPDLPDRPREDGGAPAHAVDLQVADALVRLGTVVTAGHDRYPVSPGEPPGHLSIEVRTGSTGLGMSPIAVGEDQYVQRHRRRRVAPHLPAESDRAAMIFGLHAGTSTRREADHL